MTRDLVADGILAPGWQANSGTEHWQTHLRCPGCPHQGAVGADQMWRPLRRQSDRARVDPWDTLVWRVRHPGMIQARRALRWLTVNFAR